MKCPVCKSEIAYMEDQYQRMHIRKCKRQEREYLAELYDPRKDVSRDL